MMTAKRHRMKELCEITSSKRIFAADYQPEGIPFYRGKEITEKHKGNLDVTTELFIDPEKFEAIRAKFGAPVAGDLLLTSVGTLGSPYVVRAGETFYFKDGNLTWFRKLKNLDGRYLYYWLLSPHGRAELKKCTIGSSQSAYTIVLLKDMEIDVPPLPTQRKIAGTLSAYDDLIENNLRRIKILEQMAQSLYREWFVHFRFPGHETADFADSALGQIPKGWEVKKLETLYRTSSGGTPSRKNLEYYEEGTIDWVKTGELKDCFVLSSEEKITAQALSKSSAKLFPANTVLIALYGATIGQLGILSRDAATNQACCAILEVEQPFGRAFAYLTLLLRRDDIIGLRIGAAQQNISQAVLRDFEVICPPIPLLDAFNKRAEAMFDLLLNLQRRNETLRRTRDILLPKLLSGGENSSE